MCQVAKRYGKKIDATIVHHILPRSQYPQYALCDWNLISVSKKGHLFLENELGLTEEGLKLARRVMRERKISEDPPPSIFFPYLFAT